VAAAAELPLAALVTLVASATRPRLSAERATGHKRWVASAALGFFIGRCGVYARGETTAMRLAVRLAQRTRCL